MLTSSGHNQNSDLSVRADADIWFLSGALQSRGNVAHVPIDEQPFHIGRKSGVSLRLGFKTVSSVHASLRIEGGKLLLTDENSTNGTFVNGSKVDGEIALSEEDLAHFAEAPFRVRRQSPSRSTTGTIARNVCDEALALVQFDRLMQERLVRPHYQPIVEMRTEDVVGFEVLGRGSVFGLESVSQMFQAAEQLNLEVELSSLLRWEGIRIGRGLPESPELFVNTHPKEIEDIRGLIQSLRQLRKMDNRVPMVLEIHEAAVTRRDDMHSLAAALLDLVIRLAFDDFGSGQARLAELVEAKPDFVKFDISLIRSIDAADKNRRQLLESLVQMVRDLNICALAEGIETEPEAIACREVGFDLAQGYYFGRPASLDKIS